MRRIRIAKETEDGVIYVTERINGVAETKTPEAESFEKIDQFNYGDEALDLFSEGQSGLTL